MPGRVGFTERVAIPLAVIVATVLFLGGVGWKLAGIKPRAVAVPAISEGPVASPTTAVSASASPAADQLSVQVFNGTSTAGLARRTADTINAQGWVIASVSNWNGQKLTKTTVFYPEGYRDQAARLAELVSGKAEPADTLLPQNVLTLVVID